MGDYDDWISQNMPTQLFHYTTSQGLLGIVESRAFFASHILFQNDSAELNLAVSLFKNSLLKHQRTVASGDQSIQSLFKTIDQFSSGNIFVVSFSEEVDILSQYRGYGGSGQGFCLGFKTEHLVKRIEERKKSGETSSPGVFEGERSIESPFDYRFFKCVYDEKTQLHLIDQIVQNELNKSHKSELERTVAMAETIVTYAPLFKSKHFVEEKEWRLVISNVNRSSENVRFRTGKSHFIPYFHLSFSDPSCFGDVVIGPSTERDLVRDSTERLCFHNGIRFGNSNERSLRTSEIPFRAH